MYLHSHPLIRIPIHIRKWTSDLFTDTESFLSRSLVVQFHDDTKRAFADHSDRTIMTNGVSRTCFPSFLLSFSTFFFLFFFSLRSRPTSWYVARTKPSRNEMETARRILWGGNVYRRKEKKGAIIIWKYNGARDETSECNTTACHETPASTLSRRHCATQTSLCKFLSFSLSR